MRFDQKHLIVIWGARIFSLFRGGNQFGFSIYWQYSTPELVKSLNVQGEMNLHNLNFWNAPTWFASLTKNSFDLRILFSSANLFRIAFTAYFLIVPLFCHTFSKCSRLRRLYFILPDNFFLISVWSSIVLSIIMSFYGSADRLKALSETREMIYSLAIFILCKLSTSNLKGKIFCHSWTLWRNHNLTLPAVSINYKQRRSTQPYAIGFCSFLRWSLR